MILDWVGWDSLTCSDQRYAIGVAAFAFGATSMLTVEALFGSRGQRRKVKAKRGRR